MRNQLVYATLDWAEMEGPFRHQYEYLTMLIFTVRVVYVSANSTLMRRCSLLLYSWGQCKSRHLNNHAGFLGFACFASKTIGVSYLSLFVWTLDCPD